MKMYLKIWSQKRGGRWSVWTQNDRLSKRQLCVFLRELWGVKGLRKRRKKDGECYNVETKELIQKRILLY